MKAYRSMVLVSSDPASIEQGANEVYQALQSEINAYGLENEISLTMVGDVGRHDAVPLVIVYPEAVIYGPVTKENVHHLVEEHLYKGRIASTLQAPIKELSGKIAWLNTRKGTLPAEQRIV
ncbi:MAG TPA: (2Fe-2S) ferredoxin domain-containing protein, partial [Anaerolineaceae bacterium]|nr:(2Fe-2S) ferredoxin domain-containing protein [Anaerolineaceae bacterium]